MDTASGDVLFSILEQIHGDDDLQTLVSMLSFIRSRKVLYNYIKYKRPGYWQNVAKKLNLDISGFQNPVWGLLSVAIAEGICDRIPRVFINPINKSRIELSCGWAPEDVAHEFDYTIEGDRSAIITFDPSRPKRLKPNSNLYDTDAFEARNVYNLFKAGYQLQFGKDGTLISNHCNVCAAPATNVCSHCMQSVYCGEECQRLEIGTHL